MIKKNRINKCFKDLKIKDRSALVTFITAGDPDYDTSKEILNILPESGSDIIELGMPFSDPMADGKVIQESYKRSLKNGQTLRKTLDLVKEFRKNNNYTPIILMGYYNPIYSMGVSLFLKESIKAGVDGLIVVDLPPEADKELCIPANNKGLCFIRLASPTTDANRLPIVVSNSSGFIYYISITGITGTKSGDINNVELAVNKLKKKTILPVAVGFGINTPKKAAAIAKFSDAVVIGSTIVNEIVKALEKKCDIVKHLSTFISKYSDAIRQARK